MLVTAIGLRCCMGLEKKFSPFSVSRDYSEEEIDKLTKLFPNKVDAGYNNWILDKYKGEYSARRATWTMSGLRSFDFEELLSMITERCRVAGKLYTG
jgi:hypothetical protein